MVSHSKVAMRRLSTARLWPRAEYSWGIGLRGERTKQNGGQENNRTKDRAKDRMEDRARDRAKDMAKDRAEDRTRDRTENRTGQKQNLLCLPLQGDHEEAVRSPAVVQGKVHLRNRVERREDRSEHRMEDRRITGQRTGRRTEDGTGQKIE